MRTQDFIEKYYPNYHNSDEIARLNDLQKLIDKEFVEGDSAHTMMLKEFGSDYDRALPMILQEHIRVSEKVYEKSIENV